MIQINNDILRKVYDHLKYLCNEKLYNMLPEEQKKEEDKIIGSKSIKYVKITEKGRFSFGETFSLKFEDLPYAFEELEKRELLKFFGRCTVNKVNPATQYSEAVPAYAVQLSGFKDSEIEFRNNHKKYTGIQLNAKSWNEVKIEFLNAFEIEISVNNNIIEKFSVDRLKFYNGPKSKKPDRQWQFLRALSFLQGKNGMGATKDAMCSSLSTKPNKKIEDNNCEKIVKKLSDNLNNAFGMSGKPINSYEDYKCYKPVFTLIPETIIRGDGESFILPRSNFNDNIGYEKDKNDTDYLDNDYDYKEEN